MKGVLSVIERRTKDMKTFIGKPQEKENFEYFGLNGRIILIRILKIAWGCGMDSFGSQYGPMAGSCCSDKKNAVFLYKWEISGLSETALVSQE